MELYELLLATDEALFPQRRLRYWNIATEESGRSTWGWTQNSLVSVDTSAKTYCYNHDYYLMKHLAHFVDVGAHSVETGACDDALAFVNPDRTVVLLVCNELTHAQMLQVQLGARSVPLELPPDSIGTLALKQT